jgi:DNA-binding GntR family transcriptional regulator
LRPPATKNLSENTYFELRNRILRGDYPPDSPLLEESLSAEFGVSRTPVRGALARLLSEGFLVQGEEDRTLRVPAISRKELQDTFEARRTLEAAVLELACRKATPEQIARLEHLVWDEREAFRIRERPLIAAVDRFFHNYLAEMADNGLYRNFVEHINFRVSLFLALSDTLGEVIGEALEEHERILEAVRSRSPERGREAMLNHLSRVEERILESLDRAARGGRFPV